MHWSPVADTSEIQGAARVRVIAEGHPPVVLHHPTEAQIEATVAARARIEVRRLYALPTALIITAAVLATLGTAGIILAIAVGHGSG